MTRPVSVTTTTEAMVTRPTVCWLQIRIPLAEGHPREGVPMAERADGILLAGLIARQMSPKDRREVERAVAKVREKLQAVETGARD